MGLFAASVPGYTYRKKQPEDVQIRSKDPARDNTEDSHQADRDHEGGEPTEEAEQLKSAETNPRKKRKKEKRKKINSTKKPPTDKRKLDE